MPDRQSSEMFEPDDFQKRLLNCEDPHRVSPKMTEYIEMMEAYLLIREKKVLEKTNFNEITLS